MIACADTLHVTAFGKKGIPFIESLVLVIFIGVFVACGVGYLIVKARSDRH